MSNLLMAFVAATAVCGIVVYRHKRRMSEYGNPLLALSKRDRSYATEACSEGLRCIGYSCAQGCDNPAEAAEVGLGYCQEHGISAVAVASLVAGGMVGHYAAHHGSSDQVVAGLLLEANNVFARTFSTDAEAVHDARVDLLANQPLAHVVVDAIARAGFRSSILVQDTELGDQLRTLLP